MANYGQRFAAVTFGRTHRPFGSPCTNCRPKTAVSPVPVWRERPASRSGATTRCRHCRASAVITVTVANFSATFPRWSELSYSSLAVVLTTTTIAATSFIRLCREFYAVVSLSFVRFYFLIIFNVFQSFRSRSPTPLQTYRFLSEDYHPTDVHRVRTTLKYLPRQSTQRRRKREDTLVVQQ